MRLLKPGDKRPWNPLLLGLSIVIGYLLIRCALDGLFMATWGFPVGYEPLWRSPLWWPEIVNATLMGYIPAALLITRRGVERDLIQLKPSLSCSAAEFTNIQTAATGSAGLGGQMFMLGGFVAGVLFVIMEPSLYWDSEPTLSNPAFVWAVLRIPVFILLICLLMVADNKGARTYLHVGRNLIEVDLLDVQSLSPFARRGLRSALTWVIFLIIFSLFWLGEGTAARQNPYLFVTVMALACATFVVPLIGVHNNIVSVKGLELARLRDQIRIERDELIDDLAGESPSTPRLSNLIAYHQLIDGTREWPIDAANLLKFFMYLLIGLGSWLGGAFVERLLDSTLGG